MEETKDHIWANAYEGRIDEREKALSLLCCGKNAILAAKTSKRGMSANLTLPVDVMFEARILQVDTQKGEVVLRPTSVEDNYWILKAAMENVLVESRDRVRINNFTDANVYYVTSGGYSARTVLVGSPSFHPLMYDVDSGMFERVDINNVFNLPQDVRAIPPLSFRASLPSQTEANVTIGLHKRCCGLKCWCKICSVSVENNRRFGEGYPPIFYARLYGKDVDDCGQEITFEYACIQNEYNKLDREITVMEDFKEYEIKLPATVHIAVTERLYYDGYMMRDVNLAYRISKEIVVPKTPLHVEDALDRIACIVHVVRPHSHTFKQFYRAVAREFDMKFNKCTAYLVDYGQTVDCNLNDIYDITEQSDMVCNAPLASFECKMARFWMIDGSEMRKFRLFEEKEYKVKLLSRNANNLYEADLLALGFHGMNYIRASHDDMANDNSAHNLYSHANTSGASIPDQARSGVNDNLDAVKRQLAELAERIGKIEMQPNSRISTEPLDIKLTSSMYHAEERRHRGTLHADGALGSFHSHHLRASTTTNQPLTRYDNGSNDTNSSRQVSKGLHVDDSSVRSRDSYGNSSENEQRAHSRANCYNYNESLITQPQIPFILPLPIPFLSPRRCQHIYPESSHMQCIECIRAHSEHSNMPITSGPHRALQASTRTQWKEQKTHNIRSDRQYQGNESFVASHNNDRRPVLRDHQRNRTLRHQNAIPRSGEHIQQQKSPIRFMEGDCEHNYGTAETLDDDADDWDRTSEIDSKDIDYTSEEESEQKEDGSSDEISSQESTKEVGKKLNVDSLEVDFLVALEPELKYKAYFKHIELPKNDVLTAIRCDSDTTNRYWPLFFIKVAQEDLSRIFEELLNFVPIKLLSSEDITVGKLCALYSKKHKTYIRTIITDLRDNQVEVLSIDYGDYELVESKDLKAINTLSDKVLKHPGAAIPCILEKSSNEKVIERWRNCVEKKHRLAARIQVIEARPDSVYTVRDFGTIE